MGVIERFTEERGKYVFILPNETRIELDATDIDNIFKGYRPRNMSLQDFKEVSKIIKQTVKEYTKGNLVHISKVTNEVWKNYTGGKKIKQRGNTYKHDKK